MIEKIIAYFAKRHMLVNMIAIAVFIGGIYYWTITPKEDMPNIQMNFLRISAVYSGASPEDVEHFITKPIEDEIKGVDGIYRVTSTSGVGMSSIMVEIDINKDGNDLVEVVNDITDAVNRVNLPSEVRDKPTVRQFKTSQRAIIDVALVSNKEILDKKTRTELQRYALALEQQLLGLSEINSINRSGYLKQEIQIRTIPEMLKKYNISISTIIAAVKAGHIREPAGTIKDADESRVTLISELDEAEKLKKLIIRGGFEGQEISLDKLANIVSDFEEPTSILKVNGHEAIILNAVKSTSSGIIKAVDILKKRVNEFKSTSLKDKQVDIFLLDDESENVRQRLSLIGMNGILGFVIIIIMLLLMLDLKAGIWVALGIPFSFCFTMIVTSLMGFTINNMTLAGVIIVMGMIVDDAIVVAENVNRTRKQGVKSFEASVKGTAYVLLPVFAAIITTCVAFIPLLMWDGRLSKMIYFIPVIISVMLGASLIESIIILPAHLDSHVPSWIKNVITLGIYPLVMHIRGKLKKEPAGGKHKKKSEPDHSKHFSNWFNAVEDAYGKFLHKVLCHKVILFSFFILLLVLSGFLFTSKMKYVMFPDEEATEITIMGETRKEAKRLETALVAGKLEAVFSGYLGKEVVGFRTNVGQSRFGRAAQENTFTTNVQIVSRENREKSLSQLKQEWQEKLKTISELSNIRFLEHRFGQSSGSPIEIMIQENDDNVRAQVVDMLYKEMLKHPALSNVEIDRPMTNTQYKVELKRDMVSMLSIKAAEIGSTLRAVLQGSIAYELLKGDDEIDVVVTADDEAKKNINRVVQFPIANNSSYLVPIAHVVDIKSVQSPISIEREDYKRTAKIYADLKSRKNDNSKLVIKQGPPGQGKAANDAKQAKNAQTEKPEKIDPKYANMSPLEIAEDFEANVFPMILSKHPTSLISFKGEVQDTRESQSDMYFGIIAVLLLIYGILAILFNSTVKPIIIMISIPFGAVGVILAFWLHGIMNFGFFAAVGAIGLMGVVVNDSIVMIAKLEKEYDVGKHIQHTNMQIADIAKTRLKAVLLTTLTTVAGLFPTAYGVAGYDSMLAEMMLAMGWGLIFATLITLFLTPSLYSLVKRIDH